MNKNILVWAAGVSLAVLTTSTAWAATEAPVIRKGGQVVMTSSTATLMDAETALRRGDVTAAEETYRAILNTEMPSQRAQARFGMAVTLAQEGREAEALDVLEGTTTDDSPLGKAVGEWRGLLLLMMADKALATKGYAAAEPYLDRYDRLTVQPDRARYERLRAVGMEAALMTPTTAPLTVAVMVPLSGPLKAVGDDVVRGVEMGMYAPANDRTGFVRVKIVDTARKGGAEAAAREALAANPDVVVGPLLRGDVENVSDMFRAKRIPMLVLSSDRAVLGDGVMGLNYLPSSQAQAAVRYAVAQGKTTLAALVPNTPYGTDALDAFRAEAEAAGAEVVGTAFYNPSAVDIGANVRELVPGKTVPFDALFVPAPAATLPLIAAQLAYYGVTPASTLLLGTQLWNNPSLMGTAGKPLKGAVFSAQAEAPGFTKDFTALYGRAPAPLAVLGYDAVRILTDVAVEKRRTSTDLATLLQRPEGFYAEGGFIRFLNDGSNDRGLKLVKIGEGSFDTLRPALSLAAPAVPDDLLPSDGGKQGKWW